MVRYADPGAVEWVESGGGPLVVIPEDAMQSWRGYEGPDGETDYDRACAAGWVGLVPLGKLSALVLGDDPASTTYLPEHRLFVRWHAADSEQALLTSVGAAIETAQWETELVWDVPGPVVLFDSGCSGARVDDNCEDRIRIELDPGRYSVRAADVAPDSTTSFGLVQLRQLSKTSGSFGSRNILIT